MSRPLPVLALLILVPAAARAEVPPAASLPCFPGAYYRKAVSSQDLWTGIEGVVTLPEFQPDPSRTNPKTGRPLDNVSIYLGGLAGEQEIDAGVLWEVIREADGSVSKQRKAYRPFWRNEEWYSGPAKPDFYYYPGDRLRLRVETREEGKLQLSVQLLERGEKGALADSALRPGTPPVQETTAGAGLTMMPADAQTSLSITFDAPGFGPGRLQEFKRVNAIDQGSNEGVAVTATATSVGEAAWDEVWLLRGKERVPMTATRFTDMRCPDAAHVTVAPTGETGERITLQGTPTAQ